MATDYPVRFSAQLRQHLKAFRKARKLTQAQLGDLIGVSQARIAEIEANPGLVSFEQLLQLLSALEVTLFLNEDLPKWQAPEFAPSPKRVAERFAKNALVGAYANQEEVSRRGAKDGMPSRYNVRQPAGSWDVALPESSEHATDVQSAESAQSTTRRDYIARPKKGTW
jgi:HTH-type transcriptional regulator/antitoxin HipB